jgi:hypothetical protein
MNLADAENAKGVSAPQAPWRFHHGARDRSSNGCAVEENRASATARAFFHGGPMHSMQCKRGSAGDARFLAKNEALAKRSSRCGKAFPPLRLQDGRLAVLKQG